MAPARTASEAYAVYDALSRLLNAPGPGASDPIARPVPFALALRAALHPALRPFRADPSLPLDGQFVSLDAHVLSLAAAAADCAEARAALSGADRQGIGFDLPTGSDLPATIGGMWGAVYVPHLGRAMPCRVRAVLDRSRAASDERVGGGPAGWNPPIAVRPVGVATQSSAENALKAAMAFLEYSGALPPGLCPAPLYFDVCASDVPDTVIEDLSGSSLALPFALCFVSVLLDIPIRAGIAATGNVGGSPEDLRRIAPVGQVDAKVSAVRRVCGPAPVMIAPEAAAEPLPGLCLGAATLDAAVSVALSPWAVPEAETPTASVSSPAYLCLKRPDASRDVGEEWHRLADSVLRRYGGRMLPRRETKLDCAVFEDTRVAAEAALAFQQTLLCHVWPNDAFPLSDLLPGAGIHTSFETGWTQYPEADRDAARRIAEAANPGQVLVSETTRDALGSAGVSPGLNVEPLGVCRLRDLRPPAPVFQITRINGPMFLRSFGPLRALDADRHNLPVQMTPFLGRADEKATLTRLLMDSSTRLVTLTGTGGVGKTRLALETAIACVDAFPDGVWLVPLRGTQGADDIAVAVARALGLTAQPGQRSALDTARDALASRRLLLLMDDGQNSGNSAEGIEEFLEDLWRDAPHAVILATARLRLKVPCEVPFPVSPLPTIDVSLETLASSPDLPDHVRRSPSALLFFLRARLARPGLSLASAEECLTVLRICHVLEGLPLAIELAASHAGTLPLAEIDQRLRRALAGSGGSGKDSRGTVRRTLEWSYALLGAPERDLLASLSVFADGFTREAAESVGSAARRHDQDDANDEEAAEVLSFLEERALIQSVTVGRSRYFLLDPVREFAARKLVVSGHEPAARAAHARYFASFAEKWGRYTDLEGRVRASDALDAEMSNIRQAVEYFRAIDPDPLPIMVRNLGDFLRHRGHLREWDAWTGVAVALIDNNAVAADDILRMRLHLFRAHFYMDIQDTEAAETHLAIVDERARLLGDRHYEAHVSNQRGLIQSRAKNYESAQAFHQNALTLYREYGTPAEQIQALNNLGIVSWRRRDWEMARAYQEESVSLCRRVGDRRGLAISLNILGTVMQESGELPDARHLYEEFLAISRDLRDPANTALALFNLGDLLEIQGEIESAMPLLALAEAMFIHLRHRLVKEADAYMMRAAERYGLERLAALRARFALASLADLQRIDPRQFLPRHLDLVGVLY